MTTITATRPVGVCVCVFRRREREREKERVAVLCLRSIFNRTKHTFFGRMFFFLIPFFVYAIKKYKWLSGDKKTTKQNKGLIRAPSI